MSRNFAVKVKFTAALLPLVALVFLSLSTMTSCRKKDPPLAPHDTTQPPVGAWNLVLDAPARLYRSQPGGHVNNDTITVRLYDPYGHIVGGAAYQVWSYCDIDSGKVTPVVTLDTNLTRRPWGGNPALIYWGNGGAENMEVVRSFAKVNGLVVDSATAAFKVLDPPVDTTTTR